MRKTVSFNVSDIKKFKEALLHWARQFDEAIWLDSNGHKDIYSSFDALLAIDAFTWIITDTQNAFEKLKEYRENTKDWLFGYLSYDLKNDVENLESNNSDGLYFPELHFFQAKKIIKILGNRIDFIYLRSIEEEIDDDFASLLNWNKDPFLKEDLSENLPIKLRTIKDAYFQKVGEILDYIHLGYIYEANFCQELYAENAKIDPLRTFQKLNIISPAPFATFLKLNDKYLLSASPERYLKRIGNNIISQPIKGTSKRSANFVEDGDLKKSLSENPKERAENTMIVDLVRNDLSKSAIKGSVKIEEFCKVYSFEQAHQMISTISSIVFENKNSVDIIRETFPMGSMTGAPKISAMKIIETVESFKRGLYSGSVGYFTPEGDFDFNVVIRSILYNASKKYLSFSVGGAITANSNPQQEYEECLLKAKAMCEVLEYIIE